MLALLSLGDQRLAHFEFGTTIDPRLDDRELLRRALSEYHHRADEIWDVRPHLVREILLEFLPDARRGDLPLTALVDALGQQVVDEAAPLLEPLLEHSEAAVRLATIRALGRIGQHSSIKLLGNLILSQERPVRVATTVALGKFGVPATAIAALGHAGEDADLKVLALCAVARSWAQSKADSNLFINAVLETPEWLDLRGWYGFVVKELQHAVRSPKFSDVARARAAAICLHHRSRRCWREAMDFAQDDALDLETRTHLAIGFGRARIPNVLPWLIAMLTHENEPMHEAAIIALGRIGRFEAEFPLLRRWNERDGALRPLLLVALRRLCEHEGARVLWDVVQNNRDAPPGPLVFINDEGVLSSSLPRDWLAAQLQRRNVEARRDAVLLLTTFGGAADLPELLSLRQRESDAEMNTILDACIARLGTRTVPPAIAPWPTP